MVKSAALKQKKEKEKINLDHVFQQSPAIIILFRGPDHIFELVNPLAQQVLGKDRQLIGKPVRDALPEIAGQGFFEILDRVYATGKTFTGQEMQARIDRTGHGQLEDGYFNLTYQPVRDAAGNVVGVFEHAVDVTDQVLARRKIEESEEKYHMIFDSLDEGFCIIEVIFDQKNRPVDYRFLETNKAFETQTGLRNVIGKRAKTLIPDIDNYWIDLYGRVALTGKPVRYENEVSSLNRSYSGFANRIGGKNSRKLVVIFKDITKIRESQKNLHQYIRKLELLNKTSEELLYADDPKNILQTLCRSVMEYLDCHVFLNFLVDREKGKLRLNACEGLTGAERKSLEWLDFGVAVCGYVARSGKRVIAEHIPDSKDARTDLIRGMGITAYCCHPLNTADGTVAGTLSFGAKNRETFKKDDIELMKAVANQISTALSQQKIKAEVRQRERQLQNIIDSTPDIICVKDPEGKFVTVNRTLKDMLGRSQEELKGKTDYDLFAEEEAEKFRQHDKRIIETGIPQQVEETVTVNNGYHVFLANKFPLYDSHGSISAVGTVSTDITDRKKLEEKKDEFLSMASHELKTPLTSIKVYIQLLERIIKDMGNDKAIALISKTDIYIDRLNSLISDLLDVSKIQAGKLQLTKETFDIRDLVRQGIESIQLTSRHHTIELNGTISHPVSGDRNRLEQVLVNFLTNAIKYSPGKDRVVVSTRRVNGEIRVSVTDFGIGIPKEKQKMLFSRFYRVDEDKQQFPGLGIGLYISSEIIKLHNGRVWMKSIPGKGSTFSFSLPVEALKIPEIRSNR